MRPGPEGEHGAGPVTGEPGGVPAQAGIDAVIAAARAGEPDRYLAALLAPPALRPALLALAAFSAEIRRIPLLVHEPAMAAIRAGIYRDPFPEFQRLNPEWTRERWDRAVG